MARRLALLGVGSVALVFCLQASQAVATHDPIVCHAQAVIHTDLAFIGGLDDDVTIQSSSATCVTDGEERAAEVSLTGAFSASALCPWPSGAAEFQGRSMVVEVAPDPDSFPETVFESSSALVSWGFAPVGILSSGNASQQLLGTATITGNQQDVVFAPDLDTWCGALDTEFAFTIDHPV